MLRGHRSGGPLSTATHRTPEADGLLRALLATHHMPHALSGYIAYSPHVPIQLDESGGFGVAITSGNEINYYI